MKVEEYTENEDGSATLIVDLTQEEVSILLEGAIVRAIEEYLKKQEQENLVFKRRSLPSNSFEL